MKKFYRRSTKWHMMPRDSVDAWARGPVKKSSRAYKSRAYNSRQFRKKFLPRKNGNFFGSTTNVVAGYRLGKPMPRPWKISR